jgi:hypothetical protein
MLSSFSSLSVLSQNADKQNERLKVFIDCSNTWCDQTFIKTEINIVDFLLDRLTADVHVLITSHNTGGGGRRYQMIFYGQNRFNALPDTITYNVEANTTEVESRELLLKYLKLGLIPFITKTGLVSGITVGMKQDAISGKPYFENAGKKDPWNYWVITLSTDGNISSEQAVKNYGYNGNLSASRITEEVKVGFAVYGSNSSATYKFENDSSFVAKKSDYGLWHYFVKSINRHWSAGYETIYNNSTYSNYKRQLYIRTAGEYNIFPYQEINNRALTLSYGVIIRFNRYYDTTLFDKLKEILFAHSFRVNLSLNKKWGTIHTGVFYSNFFHDWKLNNLGVNLSVNVRITGGLSFNISSFGGLVHDQVYLPKSGATQQEVLTRLRELKSGYNIQNRVGVSYRFGSKLNNFVNPRFDGG